MKRVAWLGCACCLLAAGAQGRGAGREALLIRQQAVEIDFRGEGRRLVGEEYNFATQLEVVLCPGAGVRIPTSDPSAMRQSVAAAMGVDLGVVTVTNEVLQCQGGWENRISIWNESGERSASEIAATQVDSIYADQPAWLAKIAEGMLNAGVTGPGTSGTDYTLNSLGYLVVWLDGQESQEQGGAVTSGKSNNTVKIAGKDVYWPWWVWLLYVVVVVCCIVPLLIYTFKEKRERELIEMGAKRDAQARRKSAGSW
ncbi:unnamed protein product [Chrysoparadoxa australica]